MANIWNLQNLKFKINTTPDMPTADVLYFDVVNQQFFSGTVPVTGAGSGTTMDYNSLTNKPSINSVVLQGNKTWNDLGLDLDHMVNIYQKTTAQWNSTPLLRSENNTLYIYTDHQRLNDVDIPGIKIGDGSSYVADLPFTDAMYAAHIADSSIHVTPQEKTFWNNKLNYQLNGEQLLLNRN